MSNDQIPSNETGTAIRCCDCGDSFLFTDGERRFYEERGYSTPRRCRPCRAIKKATREQQQPG